MKSSRGKPFQGPLGQTQPHVSPVAAGNELAGLTGTVGCYDPLEQTFTFRLGNVSARDANFLAEIVKLFCDPMQAGTLARLRQGGVAVQYQNGHVEIVPVYGKN